MDTLFNDATEFYVDILIAMAAISMPAAILLGLLLMRMRKLSRMVGQSNPNINMTDLYGYYSQQQ